MSTAMSFCTIDINHTETSCCKISPSKLHLYLELCIGKITDSFHIIFCTKKVMKECREAHLHHNELMLLSLLYGNRAGP